MKKFIFYFSYANKDKVYLKPNSINFVMCFAEDHVK